MPGNSDVSWEFCWYSLLATQHENRNGECPETPTKPVGGLTYSRPCVK